MAGRGDITEEVQTIKASMFQIPHISVSEVLHAHFTHAGIFEVSPVDTADTSTTPAYCLRLPGRRLNLTALLYAKRFRDHGYKTGALAAFNELEEAGLGRIEKIKAKSAVVSFD